MPTKIYVVRNTLTGGITKAFRNEQKADDYKAFLDPPIERPIHAVDEVELDDEVPKPEVGPPHSVRMTIAVVVHVRVGEIPHLEETEPRKIAAYAQKWVRSAVDKALGDVLVEYDEQAVEVLDEQNRRVDG